MLFQGLKIGFAITGSFCTISNVVSEIEKLVAEGAEVYPILSKIVDETDTRFGKAKDLKDKLKAITGKNPITTIPEAEPIGPKAYLDILVIAPCTGNTLAKLSNAITDTSVTMAFKAHSRNQRPAIIAVSTNDGLGANAHNLGKLLNTKNVYIVPLGQDNPADKPNSLIAKTELIIPTIVEALKGKQIQPVII
ncbi:MAG: dipicolinate synthase subunit B [Bacillota bacterium]|nr:dipicolinate synthase subunit B [Bacillota bacterium]